jgi:hypothetical protein
MFTFLINVSGVEYECHKPTSTYSQMTELQLFVVLTNSVEPVGWLKKYLPVFTHGNDWNANLAGFKKTSCATRSSLRVASLGFRCG